MNKEQSRMLWRVQDAAKPEVDIDIFDAIGDPWQGTTGADFAKELRGLKNASRINLHINSPGGVVSDGLQMYAAIKQHSAQIVAYIESQAASAASFVAMAADKIVIFPNAKMVIHDAQVPVLIGPNAQDMRRLAQMLDEESDNIAGIYAERAGGDKATWRDAMKADKGNGTTYRGQDAVDAGLADEVASTARAYDPTQIAALVTEDTKSDLSAIKTSAVREKPMPTLERLLAAHPLKLEATK